MFEDHFTALGARIEAMWEKYNFDTHAFPDLAVEELERSRTLTIVPADDVIPWVMGKPRLPYQVNLDATFGEPPITLYWSPRFFIEALHWTDGTPGVHQHGFSGAFGVWAGSSVQSRFSFVEERRVNAAMLFGRVSLDEVRVLETGAVEQIRGGSALIHSTFHLDRPSVTLVIRTHSDKDVLPQWLYWRPCLAIDPTFTDPLLTRRLQLLGFLDRIRSESFDGAATLALAHSDLYGAFRLLQFLKSSVVGSANYSHWLETAHRRHGPDILQIDAALSDYARRELIRDRRAIVGSTNLRFFLALLVNLSSRDSIFGAIAQRFPDDDPRELVVAWATEMSGLELSGIEFDQVNRLLFTYLLEGDAIADIVPKLATVFDFAETPEAFDDIRQHCDLLRDSALFRALLQAE